jgi:uncharacterized protein (DUF58 family)
VRERHPERDADVVVFLDTFSDAWSGGGSTTLERAVRAAATVVRAYAWRHDRVGLVSFGGILRWLQPGTGERQLYRIVDALLDTESRVSYSWKGIGVIPVRVLPPRALIVAITPLLDDRTVTALFDLRARGFDVAAIDVSPVPTAPRRPQLDETLAYRIWVMERAALRRRLREVGIAVAEWADGDPVQRPLWEVASSRRMVRLASGS